MRLRSAVIGITASALLATAVRAPHAQEPDGAMHGAMHGALHVVNHVDIVPPVVNQALALLRQFAADSRKDPGCLRFDVLQQADRGNHFALVETWRDQAAFDVHSAAEHTRRFRFQLQPMLGSPFDERLYHLVP